MTVRTQLLTELEEKCKSVKGGRKEALLVMLCERLGKVNKVRAHDPSEVALANKAEAAARAKRLAKRLSVIEFIRTYPQATTKQIMEAKSCSNQTIWRARSDIQSELKAKGEI